MLLTLSLLAVLLWAALPRPAQSPSAHLISPGTPWLLGSVSHHRQGPSW